LAAAIDKEFQIQPKLIESGGGVFEVTVDGKLIFSKKELGRFPEDEEILSKLREPKKG
jgi:selenoprotein W-related protein